MAVWVILICNFLIKPTVLFQIILITVPDNGNSTIPGNGTNTTNPNNGTGTGNNGNSTLPNNGNSTLPNNGTGTNSTIPTNPNNGTNTTNPITEVKIENANQTLVFDQMAGSIDLNDIVITPINKNDLFEIKLILLDTKGKPIKGALITQGQTDDDKYRSNYDEKTGIWQIVKDFDKYDEDHVTGTPALVTAEVANELLKGNAIHIVDKFKPQDFDINVSIKDVTNSKTYTNQIEGDYQCLEIPDDLFKSMINDQTTEVNKTLMMNYLNYVKDPSDKRFIGAEFKLMQAIKNDTMDPISETNLLRIDQINQTAFEVSGNKPGNYTMNFSANECNKVIDRYFNLQIMGNGSIPGGNGTNGNGTNGTNDGGPGQGNSGPNLAALIGGPLAAVAVLGLIGVAIWKRREIIEYFGGGKRRNQENQNPRGNRVDHEIVNNDDIVVNTNHPMINPNRIKSEEVEIIEKKEDILELRKKKDINIDEEFDNSRNARHNKLNQYDFEEGLNKNNINHSMIELGRRDDEEISGIVKNINHSMHIPNKPNTSFQANKNDLKTKALKPKIDDKEII